MKQNEAVDIALSNGYTEEFTIDTKECGQRYFRRSDADMVFGRPVEFYMIREEDGEWMAYRMQPSPTKT